MGESMKRAVVTLAILTSLLLAFQNCGKAGFEQTGTMDEMSTSESIDPKLATLPFPYQVSVNQIAHMSCSFTNDNPSSPYFTWKVGAFDNPSDVPSSQLGIRASGLELSSAFKSQWAQMSSNFTPAVRDAKLKEALTGLSSVANTQLQLSFRKTNTPRTDLMMMPSGASSPVMPFLTPMSSDGISDAFVTDSNSIFNMFPSVANFSSRFLEAKMNVVSNYGAETTALRANYDSSFMTIGFAKPALSGTNSAELSGPSTDSRYAFGKGFRIHFGTTSPHTGTTLYPPYDALTIVEEYDLETGARTNATWDCSYRFKIVRNADRYNTAYRANHFTRPGGLCPGPTRSGTYCAPKLSDGSVVSDFGIDIAYFGGAACPANRTKYTGAYCEERYSQVCPSEPFAANPTDPNPINRTDGVYSANYPLRPAILHALRRMLPAQEWDINVSRGCVVPKFDDNACYANGNPIVYDDYFFAAPYSNPTMGQYGGCGVNGQLPCPSYLTLCLRR